MQNKKYAFTMIELIFTIVIIGILASVAVPKLAATRDDAKISTCVHDAKGFMNQLTAYYTANGHLAKVSEMSNLPIVYIDDKTSNGFLIDTDLSVTPSGAAASLARGALFMCEGELMAEFKQSNSSTESNLSIINIARSRSDARIPYSAAQALEKAAFFRTYQLGGSNIKF